MQLRNTIFEEIDEQGKRETQKSILLTVDRRHHTTLTIQEKQVQTRFEDKFANFFSKFVGRILCPIYKSLQKKLACVCVLCAIEEEEE